MWGKQNYGREEEEVGEWWSEEIRRVVGRTFFNIEEEKEWGRFG